MHTNGASFPFKVKSKGKFKKLHTKCVSISVMN